MKKQALLIGINNYSKMGALNDLNFARQDAEAVSAYLQRYYGFTEDEITLMTCKQTGTLSPATPNNILNQLQPESLKEGQFKEPLDLFIFGFWGHGIWENNVRYLCPMTTLQNKLSDTCLPLNDVVNSIAKLPIQNVCFILDCCQNIAGKGAAQYMPKEETKYLENLARDIVLNIQNKTTANKNDPDSQKNCQVAILNACRPGEIAYEWDEKKHGIFTAHLLDAMRNRLGTVNDWTSYLNSHVSQTAAKLGKSKQTPCCLLEGNIELPVISEPYSNPLPPPLPEDELEKGTLVQAALQLVKLFQESIPLHEKENVKEWFLLQKEQFMSVHAALESGSITAQKAYSRLMEIARDAGNWIHNNRQSLGGGRHTFVSYEWCAWVKFANDNHLGSLSQELKP